MSTQCKWTALVLAAGKGTRMKSELPKVLHPLLGRPMLAWVLEAAAGAGVESVIAIVGFGRERIIETLSSKYPSVRRAVQADQRGTGHAVACAREEVGGGDLPLLILNGDAPLLRGEVLATFLAAHEASGAAASVLSFIATDPTGYGRILRDRDSLVDRIVEDQDATPEQKSLREVNSGVYAVSSSALFEALEGIRADNAQGELYLPDIVPLLRAAGRPVRVHVAPTAEDFRGINHRAELAELAAVLRARKNRELMLAGVTLEDPATTWVEQDVQVGPDTVLEAGVRLTGGTRVGTGCLIGAGSVLSRCTLDDRVQVRPYSVLDEAVVGPEAMVGPFAHLRPGTRLGPRTKVGNFVEVKATRMGEGSKASHLTYLGDSEIGAGVNIGAGTITCNFDGFSKHPTKIGDGAFIGSDSILVAPLEIGPGAFVAAGSTITHPVPARSLAIGRARQEVKENYAEVLERRFGGSKKEGH
ncbi:MAG: bifunctional UDP-N-acetylglucosamine diphosphorylase/glucosamine-1-phosphate N-acetyltransferase GlmU [Candidatus Riflebacteria bacterium]|nr:bifunctional UDP-N-acetylglucosamine diphosphorylase/glucosamine-1-phosphate N-acetyltransferase GlmU [Candidatus Riflebacteria bacterium]